MSEQDDRQLEDYLAGDSPLSRHYGKAGDQGPPAPLDSVVLANARRAIADDENAAAVRRPWPWIAPLSTAAVIVLAAALVLEITLPRTQKVTPESADVSFADEGLAGSSTDSDDVETASQPLVAGDETAGYAPAIREENRGLDAVLRQREVPFIAMPSPSSADKPTDEAVTGIVARRDAKSARGAVAAGAAEPGPDPVAAPPLARYSVTPAPRVVDDATTAALAAPPVEQAGGRSAPSEPGFFSVQADEPVSSDARTRELTLKRIRTLVREGQEDEASQLLEDLLERWPDLVLPEDFPLPDPREAP